MNYPVKESHQIALTTFAALIAVLGLFSLFRHSVSSVAFALYSLVFLACAVGVQCKQRWGFIGSLASLLPIVGLFGFQTLRRTLFVIQNAGLDQEDGMGSPLAFLMGFVFEQMFFIPSLLIFVALWKSRRYAFARSTVN